MNAKLYLRYAFNTSWKERYDIIRILLLLVKEGLIVRYMPLKYYYSSFINTPEDIYLDLQPFHENIDRINRVIKAVPWNVTCLMECLVIQSYFKKFSINVPIYIGVKTGEELKAHAWYSESEQFSYNKLSINE
ncbi:MAG: lasso peptide biosynthesis B2 protein [Bacteroidota bacterium]